MSKGRIEAFSDGVIAIIITIMVLEMKVPDGVTFAALAPVLPVFLSYVLSFIYVGIHWNNHHHLMSLCRRVDGRLMWANLHLLFWLSLIPFVTGWMGENELSPLPTALYGVVLFMAAVAYKILQELVVAGHDEPARMRGALGADLKGKLSPALYALAIGTAFVSPAFAAALYCLVALMWIVPDRRLVKAIAQEKDSR